MPTPKKAMSKPSALRREIKDPKSQAPIRTTISGVRAFSTPVSELGNCVWALAKRKEGMKLPTNPMIIRYLTCFRFRVLSSGMASGSSTSPAATMRNAPTSPGEKTSRDFLIRINELPQISDSRINNNQLFSRFLFVSVGIIERLVAGFPISEGRSVWLRILGQDCLHALHRPLKFVIGECLSDRIKQFQHVLIVFGGNKFGTVGLEVRHAAKVIGIMASHFQ